MGNGTSYREEGTHRVGGMAFGLQGKVFPVRVLRRVRVGIGLDIGVAFMDLDSEGRGWDRDLGVPPYQWSGNAGGRGWTGAVKTGIEVGISRRLHFAADLSYRTARVEGFRGTVRDGGGVKTSGEWRWLPEGTPGGSGLGFVPMASPDGPDPPGRPLEVDLGGLEGSWRMVFAL
jgi:hypothetical protein